MLEQKYTLSQMVKYVNVLVQDKLQWTVKICRQKLKKKRIILMHVRKQL